jgi:hypothetical protein|tara:strand:- start:84 stop:536 length:453 start_codon:yes stop_codon:yes gene_type:complete
MNRTAAQSGKLANSRGKQFEREIGTYLGLELGFKFSRNLEQTRTAGLGDLLCDDPDFPYTLELKRRQSGNMIPTGAWAQAVTASHLKDGIYPAVIYKYDRRDSRAVIPFAAIAESETGKRTENLTDKADISLPLFCKVVREIMAWRADAC